MLIKQVMIYFPVMTDWNDSDPHSHREGGMKYDNGKLTVPKAGRYYIYAHLHFLSEGRVQILVNDDVVSAITSPYTKEGTAETANGSGVFALDANDTISLKISIWRAPEDRSVKFWMQHQTCYFGAFLI